MPLRPKSKGLLSKADATAKAGVKGGAADVIPGVRIYQLTDSGLMAQAMLQGTKYWRDDTLNGKDTHNQ